MWETNCTRAFGESLVELGESLISLTGSLKPTSSRMRLHVHIAPLHNLQANSVLSALPFHQQPQWLAMELQLPGHHLLNRTYLLPSFHGAATEIPHFAIPILLQNACIKQSDYFLFPWHHLANGTLFPPLVKCWEVSKLLSHRNSNFVITRSLDFCKHTHTHTRPD